MDLKGIIADHMGHFSVYDVPNLLVVLVAALVFGFITARLGARLQGDEARKAALWASLGALAAALVRSQLPLAVLVLAAAVLVGKREGAGAGTTQLTMLLIGIGCGSGAAVIVGLALLAFIPILRWTALGPKNS